MDREIGHVSLKYRAANQRLREDARSDWNKFFEEEREWRRKHARPRAPEDAAAK